ncbi:MAG: PQQ-dependent sugar dehydrogenase [Wenzhouxiangella sp.]|nr:PQQ-dependent sugar dehydrogenase [Wenzhouxiangella sp.]
MTALCRLLILLLAAGFWHSVHAFQIETIAEGLEHPWSIAFLPGGRMLVPARAGRLRIIADGELMADAVTDIPEAYVAAQGGLMEVALDPNYTDNGWIYLTLAYGDRRGSATRLVRGRLQGMRGVDNQVLFTAEPARNRPVHYGARLAFLGDGTLLLTLGDAFDYREQAQKLDSHTGSIVRLNTDGSVPVDNPFVGQRGALPEIFSYGHRNPQGIVVDLESGLIWSHEHGPRGGDELNLIEAGQNYGWPVATHGVDYSGARISPYSSRPGMVDPKIDWTPSIAPAGMTQYRGRLFDGWDGDLLVASLVERSIRRIRLDGREVLSDEKLILPINRRLRDVRVSPDGALYILTDHRDGEVLRVSP